MSERPPVLDPRPPLWVHFVWHGGSTGEHALACALYEFIARNPLRPLHRGLGVPVSFWSDADLARRGIDLELATHSAVVPLVGDDLVLDAPDLLTELQERIDTAGPRSRLIPVALVESALRTPIGQRNFIRLHTAPPGPERTARLRGALVHELCRLLLERPPASAPTTAGTQAPPPVRLFISHAKSDGLGIATAIRDYVHANLGLDTFFDANDIAPGYDFAAEIEQGIDSAVLVVVQSDEYAGREWCRREVLIAKEHGRPIVVINAVRVGEERSFPYLGNVPTVRWRHDVDAAATGHTCDAVVTLALRELLRTLCFAGEAQASGICGEGDRVSAYPPELCTVALQLSRPGMRRLIYGDPPLGDEERKLLKAVAPTFDAFTPLLIDRQPLQGRCVALSISESPDMAARGWADPQLLDFAAEVARYLLASGANVGYGGDLRGGGFAEALVELVRAHDDVGTDARVRVFLYWPYHEEHLTRERESSLAPAIRFIRIPRPDGVADAVRVADLSADRASAARCLSAMRRTMTAQVHARVLAGGRLEGYMGAYPGVVEEAVLALEAGQPIYLVGGFGGATAAIIETMRGRPSPLDAIPGAAEACATLRRHGTAALRRNGLSDDENDELYATRALRNALRLILRGLGCALPPRGQQT